MSINQPTQPAEYEPTASNEQDSLFDRFLIGIGDMVIRNFTFLVIITIFWGIVTLMFIGGIALVYTVSERFRDIEGREQQRQILHEQQLDQVVLSNPIEIQEARKWDDTVWFGALNETVESVNSSGLEGLDSEDLILSVPVQKQPARLNRQLIADDQVWEIDCGDAGFVYDGSYPCPITNVNLLDSDAESTDTAASN